MKKLLIVLCLLAGIFAPQPTFAVIASKFAQTEKANDKKDSNTKNGAVAAIIGGLFLIVGFVLTVPFLKIAFLGAGVVMCIIAIVFLLRAMR